MTATRRLLAAAAVTIAAASLALPAGAAGSTATFRGAVEGRARGGVTGCYTVGRADGRTRFMTLDAFRVGKVRYSMQAAFTGDANAPGRHDLVPAPPGVTVLLVRSKDRCQWASARGRITLSDDGLTARFRATLAPSVPARGPDTEVSATIACASVDDVPDAST